MEHYGSFSAWSNTFHIRYNRKLFDSDIMYFAKIWKAHRYSYRTYCQSHHLASDFEMLEERLLAYEKRILKNRYEEGYISDQQYRDAIWQMGCKW